MFGRRINPVVLFVVLTVVAFVGVFWATWSALPHAGTTPSAGGAARLLRVEVLGVLSWAITAGYGFWLAATGRKIGNLPRRVTGGALRLVGVGELILSVLAIYAILSQPANTFLYNFVVPVGILGLAIAIPLALRDRAAVSGRGRST